MAKLESSTLREVGNGVYELVEVEPESDGHVGTPLLTSVCRSLLWLSRPLLSISGPFISSAKALSGGPLLPDSACHICAISRRQVCGSVRFGADAGSAVRDVSPMKSPPCAKGGVSGWHPHGDLNLPRRYVSPATHLRQIDAKSSNSKGLRASRGVNSRHRRDTPKTPPAPPIVPHLFRVPTCPLTSPRSSRPGPSFPSISARR